MIRIWRFYQDSQFSGQVLKESGFGQDIEPEILAYRGGLHCYLFEKVRNLYEKLVSCMRIKLF